MNTFTNKVYFLGDTHGELYRMNDIFTEIRKSFIGDSSDSITVYQVGDFGFFGFGDEHFNHKQIRELDLLAKKHNIFLKFIDGNHEDFPVMQKFFSIDYNLNKEQTLTSIPVKNARAFTLTNITYIGRGTVETICNKTVMFLGGAASIDRHLRQANVSWWPDEAINDTNINICASCKDIDIVVSHDSPLTSTVYNLHAKMASLWPNASTLWAKMSNDKYMYIIDSIKPKYIIHGHQHHTYSEEYGNYNLTEAVNVTGIDHISNRRSNRYWFNFSEIIK